MLATEHGRAAPNLAGWRAAVVVLRYFVAVRLADTSLVRHQLRGWAQHVRESHRALIGKGIGGALLTTEE
jgi:hypothetical protein